MRRIIFFVMSMVIAIYCFADYTGKTKNKIIKANWIGTDAHSSVTSKNKKTKDWLIYYNGTPAYFSTDPERATFFQISDFPQIQYPFWIKKVKNIFYNSGAWVTNQFKFRIYNNSGDSILYESENLTAQNLPVETIHNLGADSVKIDSGNFWLSILPGDTSSGSPFCVSDNASQEHSFYDTLSNWVFYTDGEFAKSVYVSWIPVSHDVCISSIESPEIEVWVDTSYQIKATAKNIGLNTETFKVKCTITNHLGNPVYVDSQTVADLDSSTTQSLTFANWTPLLYNESYVIIFVTFLVGDEVPANDTLSQISHSYENGEIVYDDGKAECPNGAIQNPNNDKDCMAVRFTPYLSSPFYIKKVKLLIGIKDIPLEWVGVFGGSATEPNLSDQKFKISNVSATSSSEWVTIKGDSASSCMTTDSNFWVVAKFTEGLIGPGIGLDSNLPIDNRSYGTNSMVTWNTTNELYGTYFDFCIRIVYSHTWEVEEQNKLTFEIDYLPTPIRENVLISYELPDRTSVSIKLYDVIGRIVKTIDEGVRNEGKHEVQLNTKELANGIYFCKFEIGKRSKTKKIILLK